MALKSVSNASAYAAKSNIMFPFRGFIRKNCFSFLTYHNLYSIFLTMTCNIKVLFIVLSLAAALLLPISRIIEVKSLPTRRDSATLHSGVTDYHYLLIIPFIRVSIINFDHGE